MQTLRVLLADDHEYFRCSVAAFLGEQKGLEIVGQAANGNEAVELADRFRPDLVLMDLHMPHRDGISAMQMIKRRCPWIKVVILSMHGSDVYREKAEESGADGFIGKERMKSGLKEVLVSHTTRHVTSTATGILARTA